MRAPTPVKLRPRMTNRALDPANLLTIFHQDWTINVASRLLTRKNASTPGGHVFKPTGINFELVQDINGMNILTKFHEDWTINVASRVKNAPPLGSNVFQAKFHEDWKINVASRVLTRKNAPPPRGGHTINVASRVKNAPPLGSHVFQANVKIFELIQDIIETNLLTKFHEDWTINVASKELKRQMLTPHNAQRTTDKTRSQKLTMSTLCSTICRNKGKPVQSKLTLPTKHKLYVSGRSTINTFCIRNYTTSLAMNSDIM
ncbi:hypothetical protein DPMN_174630 [Dreissena polymorpha]|uniref:Uncharacterized protein n=1 Tax=Dreissena polymorpha TaxID=45954 RepID=A0A9D4IFA8_DREPO|nr:hypothetical protein DPMN_174630 [Dreissena polymorpha]